MTAGLRAVHFAEKQYARRLVGPGFPSREASCAPKVDDA